MVYKTRTTDAHVSVLLASELLFSYVDKLQLARLYRAALSEWKGMFPILTLSGIVVSPCDY